MDPAEAKARLARAKPQIEENKARVDKMEREATAADMQEIALLQQRVKDAYIEVKLGHQNDKTSGTFRLRTGLTSDEVEEIAELLVKSEEAEKAGRSNEADQAVMQLIELVAYNPLITVEWLMANKDAYPILDLMSIVHGVYGLYLKHIVDARRAVRFRQDTKG